MTWRSDAEVQADGTAHVWPEDDLVEHALTGVGCPCGPRAEEQPNGVVLVVHHSLDGREQHEP